MDVSEYRKRYEAELARRAAAPTAKTTSSEASDLGDKVNRLLATLRDAKEPTSVREAALNALKAASFLGPRFARFNADFMAALREIARPDTDAQLREDVLEVLAIDKDAQAQDMLRRGLSDPKAALVSPAKALQFLGYDDHAEASGLARDLFHNSTDLGTREEALRLLASDPGSADLFARLLTDKSQPRSLRALSATGLHALDPPRFAELARAIVTDDKDYEDIRATALGALTHLAEHHAVNRDQDFVARVREIAASTPLQNLRATAGRFMKGL
jgi:hypothetical protein